MTKLKEFVSTFAERISDGKVLDFWTLRFVDPQLEKLYNAENHKSLQRTRIELFILGMIILGSGMFLLLTQPIGATKIAFYICMSAWGVIPNLLLFSRRWQRRSHHIFAISIGGCAVFLIFLAIFIIDSPVSNRDYQSGFAGLTLFLMFSTIRVRYYLAVIAAIVTWVIQIVASIVVGYGVFSWGKILGFNLGIPSAIIVGGCAGYFIELKQRSVLLHKQILFEESERLQMSCNRLDKILLNIFPAKIVNKLKKSQSKLQEGSSCQQLVVVDRWGSAKAVLNHQYPCVSVLLVDIVGFTPLSSVVAPRSMVSILNTIFSAFDDILDKFNMEKIRTIGDAYLCVGNMTKPLENHQEIAVRVGWEMLQYIKMFPPIKGYKINLRAGISCGPISAGVVGTTKWNYDIFGPPYSEAIAAEAASIPGYIAVTESVHEALAEHKVFAFERMDSTASGPAVRYRVVGQTPPTLSVTLSEADHLPVESDWPSLNSPQIRPPSPLRIMLPSDFEEGENDATISLSDSAPTSTPQELLRSLSTTAPSPPSPLVYLGSASPTPGAPQSVPPFLSYHDQLPKAKHHPSSAGPRPRPNDFGPNDLGLEPPLRTTHFFQELMRKHGVTSRVEKCEFSMGRINVEREVLEQQAERIEKGVFYMRFSSQLLEDDFWDHFLRNAQKHLSSLSFCLSCAIVLWLLTDILSSPLSPSEINRFVWVSFAVAFIVSCLFGLYINSKFYYHWTSKWISMVIMFVIGIAISLVTYFDHKTIFHFYHMYSFLCICFLYTRVWVVRSMLPVSVIAVISMYLCFAYLPARSREVYLRNILAACACCILLTAVNFIGYVGLEKDLRKEFIMTKLIQNECELHQQANETTKMLVRNILPNDIAARLCAGHKVSIVDYIPAATIMFIGIPNLYSVSKPSSVFYLLNDIYTLFDELTLECGLEKIKAVNSTYMVAAGVPKPCRDHIQKTILLAKQIMNKITQFKSPFLDSALEVRIGIACGDVVAAIVGKRKYTYDCWSDCVNTAARMESHGVPGMVQVTEQVHAALRDQYHFQERGEIFVKGKGLMKTYLLDPFE